MNETYIQFKRKRELGEIITVTFQFIRNNYKPLLKSIIKNVGPLFLIFIAAIAYYTSAIAGSPFKAMQDSAANFLIAMLVLFLALMLFYSAYYATILHYIKSYVENNGVVQPQNIRTGVRQNFLKLILLYVITSVLTIAGFMFLVIPGIYIFVPLTLASTILIIENRSISESISYCFDLVKNHWWTTFGSLLVIYILVYVIGLIFQLPVLIYTVTKVFMSSQEGSIADPSSFQDWIFISLNTFATVMQYVLSGITIISISLIYYNLNEHKNLTGTYEAIDNLGN
ncbi:hypothetical protein L1I30_09185 [Gillisia sp. M10.2A]|uniref:Glycerophosphoryl diester phosphodiesterase membrane domain-containing protein n=1 Tax=Gillisia lutea TaxID=2909668 RepID=A0ABS9EK21_9FLAO|nr:hypothetical protein [Gillisia lutea]MCF4101838.1 hypothetical protein [Gillisia lutea]